MYVLNFIFFMLTYIRPCVGGWRNGIMFFFPLESITRKKGHEIKSAGACNRSWRINKITSWERTSRHPSSPRNENSSPLVNNLFSSAISSTLFFFLLVMRVYLLFIFLPLFLCVKILSVMKNKLEKELNCINCNGMGKKENSVIIHSPWCCLKVKWSCVIHKTLLVRHNGTVLQLSPKQPK